MSGKHVATNPAILDHDHAPRQHRDALEPWCDACGLSATGSAPRMSFVGGPSPSAMRDLGIGVVGGPSSSVDPRSIR